jgi:pyridoxal phosphate-dependent aminotransferase EpsN
VDPRVYLSPPHLDGNEAAYVADALASGWVAPVGPWLARFEGVVAERCGVAHGVAVSSGTAALHLALLAHRIGPGDEVLVPTLTFAASANAVVHAGATPVFVDSDPTTWQVDPVLVEQVLAEKAAAGSPVRAVMSVDLYGQCADADALRAACERHGAVLVEDAAEGLGATYRGRSAGSLGDVAALSFNGNKIVTTSGGGMVVTDDAEIASHARHLATQARQPVQHYEHREIGYNYRLSNVLAALGTAQMERLDAKIARRREHRAAYEEALGGLPGVGFMPVAAYGEPTHWLTVMTIDPDEAIASVGDVLPVLAGHGLEARPAWKPLHLQPVFHDIEHIGGDVAERVFRTGLCLPSGSSLTDAERDEVIDALCRVLG